MGTLTTTNYGWEYPDSDGSDRIWEHYDTVFPAIDTDVKAVADAAVQLALFTGALTDYSSTFTVTAATTSPTKGNSTYTVKYMTVGKMLWYSAKIVIGSTWSAGSGDYYLLVPAALDITIGQVVPAVVTDAGTGFRVCQAKPFDSTHLMVLRPDQASAIGSAGPGTAWGNGDTIEVVGWLRLA